MSAALGLDEDRKPAGASLAPSPAAPCCRQHLDTDRERRGGKANGFPAHGVGSLLQGVGWAVDGGTSPQAAAPRDVAVLERQDPSLAAQASQQRLPPASRVACPLEASLLSHVP